jgi:hypothetical protein
MSTELPQSLAAMLLGCTARVRHYLCKYIGLAFNTDSSHSDSHADQNAVAMWLARPQTSTIALLDTAPSPPLLSLPETCFLKRKLVSPLSKLLFWARSLWRLRCSETFAPLSGFSSMTCSQHSIHCS